MERWWYAAPLIVSLLGCPGPKPTPPPTPSPEPTPICQVDEVCGCWHQPPGEGWQQLPPCPTAPPTAEPTPTPTPTPTPPPGVGCVLAGEPSHVALDQTNTLGDSVNFAMHELRPDCNVGGTCLLGNTTRAEWQGAVNAKLRQMGLCAGQHSPSTDEIAVANKASERWQGFHVFVGDDSSGPVPPGGARRTVKWSPQAFTGAWTPPSGVEPTPTPTPAGPTYGCVSPLPDRTPSKLKIGMKPPDAQGWRDATLQTKGTCDYCFNIGMGTFGGAPRCDCPMRSECPGFQCDLRDECEAYGSRGGTVWETEPAGLPVELKGGNPWVARCVGCVTMRVCTSDKSVCSAWK